MADHMLALYRLTKITRNLDSQFGVWTLRSVGTTGMANTFQIDTEWDAFKLWRDKDTQRKSEEWGNGYFRVAKYVGAWSLLHSNYSLAMLRVCVYNKHYDWGNY